MKLSNIDINNLDNELIKKIFFDIKKEDYDYADYIIIYGCHIKELLDERLNHALEVLKNHEYGKIILTGGIGAKGNFNESEYMMNYLIGHSIDKSKIIIENKSTTTEENNINILNILDMNSINKPTNVVLVTKEFHLMRIILHWSKLINNSNIHFYYDYVNNSFLSYEKVINNPKLLELVKSQVEKTIRFINEGLYKDIDI